MGVLPETVRRSIRYLLIKDRARPPLPVRWGDLRRTTPFSRKFGYDRGVPVDRFYIELFLARYASDIAGRILEIKDSTYTRRFGGARVIQADVLDIDRENAHATIIADLNVDRIQKGAFDCILLTQTLQLIYDFRAALHTVSEGLKPGGVLLLTVPGLTPISSKNLAHTWYWAFTGASVERLLTDIFPLGSEISVDIHGNVLSAVAFLEGLAVQELEPEELSVQDPDYQVVITARVVKHADER